VLFNICIEPLLRALAQRKEELGYQIDFGDRQFYVNALAYADDLILITDTEEKLEEMLKILREFCEYAHMAVNAKKCCVISSMVNGEGRRQAIERKFAYGGEELPSLETEQSTLYLGSPVGGSRKERAKPAKVRLAAMRDDILKICNSDLITVQKLDALKKFVMPMVDFLLYSGDAIASSLTKFDQYVHRVVTEWIGGKGIREPFFHMSWRDGGLGLASLRERQDALLIRALAQMLKTPDEELALIMHRFADEERQNRNYVADEEAAYLNWGGSERKHKPEVRTITIFAKALEALNRMGLKFKVTPKEVIIEQPNGKPYKSAELGGIGEYITQKINRVRWRERLLHNPKNDGIPYDCAKYFISSFEDESSNFMMNFGLSKAADTLFSFLIRGKLNTLPTPSNRRLWHQDDHK
jgi:hypothetical protein